MRRGKQYYLITTILFVPAFALAFLVKSIPFGVICAVGVVCNLLMFLRYFKEEQQNARHSNSFRELMRIADSGYLRSYQGFSPTLLDGLEDWEREEAEDFIWDSFQNRGYSDMAPLLPCLKKYDGVTANKGLCFLLLMCYSSRKAEVFKYLIIYFSGSFSHSCF